MPATVARNYRVAGGLTQAAGDTILYNVPPGYVLILKYVAVTSGSGSTVNGHVRLEVPGQVQIRLRNVTLTQFQTVEWMGQVVLNAGDQLVINADGPSLWYWASGALLSGFTGVPAGPVVLPAVIPEPPAARAGRRRPGARG